MVVVDFGAEAFLNPPYLVSVLFFMVSALSLGASPSITKTSFTPISVRDETLKNKFLGTKENYFWGDRGPAGAKKVLMYRIEVKMNELMN